MLRLVLVSIILSITSLAFAEDNNSTKPVNWSTIRTRMLTIYITPPDAKLVRNFRKELKKDGSWPDVNYAGKRTTSWEPAKHLSRLRTLTQAWFSPTSEFYQNKKLAKEISTSLNYWLHKDPRRRWWWDCVGAPQMVSMIMLMFEKKLTDYQKAKGIKTLKRSTLGNTGAAHTGQNLVWQAKITARRAILQKDEILLKKALSFIIAELRTTKKEGLQIDYSFHQHGHCLYNHGYGRNFVTDYARFVAIFDGTKFAFPRKKIDLLSASILDGYQWLTHGNSLDFGASGREITRPYYKNTNQYLGKVAKNMLTVDTGRESEFKELAARMAGKPAPPLVGNKFFHRSAIMTHHRPGWYVSARMYSGSLYNTDGLSGCEEGLLSHYIADGATCIMQHGNEYLDIFPVWDWQRIPGTTVEMKPHKPGDPRRISSTFAGGVSDGTTGIASYHLRRDALRLRKSWFFFSDSAVCLGSDIHCDTDFKVETTLNQCRLQGIVTVGLNGKNKTLKEGEHSLKANWIHHDGIGYLFQKSTPVSLSNSTRTGNWKRISGQQSADKVSSKVFTLGLPHGERVKGGSYTYAIFPSLKAEAMEKITKSPPFKIIKNPANVHAVYHSKDRVLSIVFRKKESFKWNKWSIKVNRSCLLIIKQKQKGWQMAVADPSPGKGIVKIEISLPNIPMRKINVKLNDGLNSGKSTILSFDQNSK